MDGGKIQFVDHFFPALGRPKCSDPTICNFIETRPGFGTIITIAEGDGEDVLLDRSKLPPGTNMNELELAARKLERMGFNVNPALLQQVAKDDGAADDEQPQKAGEAHESIFPDPVWPQDEPKKDLYIPTKTHLSQANKEDLLEMAEKFGVTGVDETTTNAVIREALKERFNQLEA